VAAASDSADLNELGRLLAHELFHLWNGQRLAAAEEEGRYKWFTEGITDYYADRIYYAIGEYSDSTYRSRVNGTLAAYYASPARGSTRGSIASRFWDDAQTKQYPYLQGYAFALYLQPNLPRWSGSRFDLDSLMIAAYRAAGGKDIEVTDSLLIAVAPQAARAEFSAAIARFIDGGQMIQPDSSALGPCIVLRTVPLYSTAPNDHSMILAPQYQPIRGVPGCLTLGN